MDLDSLPFHSYYKAVSFCPFWHYVMLRPPQTPSFTGVGSREIVTNYIMFIRKLLPGFPESLAI